MTQTIAVIGLGLMGGSMSARWLDAGYEVWGYDPHPARMTEHTERGGAAAGSIGDAISGVEIVVLSLPNSVVGKEVCLGEGGIADTAAAGLLVVDTTTGYPSDAIEIGAGLAGCGVRFVDATVSGNVPVARAGELVVMAGGNPADVAAAARYLEPVSRVVHHVGAVGSGARAKLIVNHVLGVHRGVLAEALVVAEKSGMDLSPMLELLRDTLAYSKAMDLWGERMVDGDHFPPASRVRQNHKDFRLILRHAEEVGADATYAAVSEALLAAAEDEGLADADNSVLVEVLRRRAGIGRID